VKAGTLCAVQDKLVSKGSLAVSCDDPELQLVHDLLDDAPVQFATATGTEAALVDLHNVSVPPSWRDSRFGLTQPPTLQHYSSLTVVTVSHVRASWALPLLPASVRTLTLDVSPIPYRHTAFQCVPVPCWLLLFLLHLVSTLRIAKHAVCRDEQCIPLRMEAFRDVYLVGAWS